MSNIVPQHRKMNSSIWADLERSCSNMVRSSDVAEYAIIVTGASFQKNKIDEVTYKVCVQCLMN